MQVTLVWFLGEEDPLEKGRLPTPVLLGFPGGSAGKESARNGRDLGSIPGLGRSPGEGNSYPLQYSGVENSMDCIVHGVTKSHTWLSDFHIGGHMSPAFWTSLPPPILSHLSSLSQSTNLSSPHLTANPHWFSILYMIMCMFQCYSLSSSYPLSPTVSTSLFLMSAPPRQKTLKICVFHRDI